MSTLDVVTEVLREVAPRALRARQIAALAGNRLPTASRTPETVISRDLALDVKDRGASSRFLRVDRGAFVLKEALPTAFYNDNDAYAAQWTRNLIAAGEIAAGVVDERSIRDLKPADVASYRQCHFFSGIGVWSRALRDAGWPEDVNIWSGSCPCQNFSSAGKREGFAGDLHLWPEWFRLIAACRPAVVIGEQVSSKAGRAWVDLVLDDLEGAGYACRAFDTPACSVGSPHRRQRLYFVAYAGERGREVVGASWLHDRGQRRDDAPRCCEAHGRVSRAVSDAAGARPRMPQDAGADRRDALTGTEALEWGPAGHLELERGGRDAGEISRAQGTSEGEWQQARDLTDEPVPPGADDRRVVEREEVVRGAARAAGNEPGFKPGDRIRIDGDPSWGGAVRGYWAQGVEWIYCRPEPGHEDGRWRPAKSGTQPLVDGIAPGVGRTRAKRLRGFGNAIVLPLAAAFVESVIEVFADAARSLGLHTTIETVHDSVITFDPADVSAVPVDVPAEEDAA